MQRMLKTPYLSSRFKSELFQVKLVQIKTAANQPNFKNQSFYASSAHSGIRPVPLNCAVCAFGLNASVHTQQGVVNTVEIVQYILMKLCKLLVQTNVLVVNFSSIILYHKKRLLSTSGL